MRRRKRRCCEYASIELKPERNWRADVSAAVDGGRTDS